MQLMICQLKILNKKKGRKMKYKIYDFLNVIFLSPIKLINVITSEKSTKIAEIIAALSGVAFLIYASSIGVESFELVFLAFICVICFGLACLVITIIFSIMYELTIGFSDKWDYSYDFLRHKTKEDYSYRKYTINYFIENEKNKYNCSRSL